VSFSPDGSRLASSSQDRTVKVWDTATGQEVLSLKGNGVPVWGVAFGPDGRLLASGSDEGTIMMWPAGAPKGEEAPRE
jgi:WD40 repeat protein